MTAAANKGPLFRMERFIWFLLAIVVGFLAAALLSVHFLQEPESALSAVSYRTDNSPAAVVYNAYIAYGLHDTDMLESVYQADTWQVLEEDSKSSYGFGMYDGLDYVFGILMEQTAIDTNSATIEITSYESYQRGFLGIRSMAAVKTAVHLVREANEWKLVDRFPFTW